MNTIKILPDGTIGGKSGNKPIKVFIPRDKYLVLAEHLFSKNKKILRVVFAKNPKKDWGLPDCDHLIIDFNGYKIGVRPDEVLILIKLLSQALYNTVKTYNIGIKKL